MLLAIDIGNTNIVYGVYQGDHLLAHWRNRTDRQKSSACYQTLLEQALHSRKIEPEQLNAVVITSVVPALTAIIPEAIRNRLKIEPLIVRSTLRTGLKLNYEQPEKLGTDRLANAVAAFNLYGGPVIVLDCGTATKICAITQNGTYLGGVIAPGLKTLVTALSATADQLPEFELIKPPAVIGANTIHCMQSGIIYGQIIMLKGLIGQMRAEMKTPAAQTVATGGLIGLLADPLLTFDHINPFLTLEGLRIIYEKNSPGSIPQSTASTN
jgi:type III pantothenate kinase